MSNVLVTVSFAAVAVVVASIETEENLRSYYVAVAVVDGFDHSAVVGLVVLTVFLPSSFFLKN